MPDVLRRLRNDQILRMTRAKVFGLYTSFKGTDGYDNASTLAADYIISLRIIQRVRKLP